MHSIALDIKIADGREHVPFSRRIISRRVSGIIDDAQPLVRGLKIGNGHSAKTRLSDEAHRRDIQLRIWRNFIHKLSEHRF